VAVIDPDAGAGPAFSERARHAANAATRVATAAAARNRFIPIPK
jgi:hypothetical protein